MLIQKTDHTFRFAKRTVCVRSEQAVASRNANRVTILGVARSSFNALVYWERRQENGSSFGDLLLLNHARRLVTKNIIMPFGCAWSADGKYVLTENLLIEAKSGRVAHLPTGFAGGFLGYIWSPRHDAFAYRPYGGKRFTLTQLRPTSTNPLAFQSRVVSAQQCAPVMGPAYAPAELHLEATRGRGYTATGSSDLLLSPNGQFAVAQGLFKRFSQVGEGLSEGDRILVDVFQGSHRSLRLNFPLKNYVDFAVWSRDSRYVLGVCRTFDNEVLPRLALLDIESRRIAYTNAALRNEDLWVDLYPIWH